MRRCAAVRFAWVALTAASSARYAAEVSAAGAGTVNCVGPLNTSICQAPAVLSRLAASSGGRPSEKNMGWWHTGEGRATRKKNQHLESLYPTSGECCGLVYIWYPLDPVPA